METSKLFNKKWIPFKYSDIFEVKKGKRVVIEEELEGKTNFVSSTEFNNGVSKMVNIEPNNKGNLITVNYDGSVGEAFYQDKPFWALDSVNVLYPKFKLTPNIAMFLITLIKKEQHRFNYGRKWNKLRMEKSSILLPVDEKGVPDWDFMDSHIKRLYQLKRITEQLNEFNSRKRKKVDLFDKKWKYFKYNDVFDIQKGYYNKRPEEIGDLNFVSASFNNNSVTDKVDKSVVSKLFKPNCITVVNNGYAGEAFYQREEFTCSHDVNILKVRNRELNPHLAMFLIEIIRREKTKFNYGRKWRVKRMKNSLIKLPLNSKEEPDWDFMERYIKSLHYSKPLEN